MVGRRPVPFAAVVLAASISAQKAECQEASAATRCGDLIAGVLSPDAAPEVTELEVPGVESGARNPELIPSLVAYRLFLRSLSSLNVTEAVLEADLAAARVRDARRKHLLFSRGHRD